MTTAGPRGSAVVLIQSRESPTAIIAAMPPIDELTRIEPNHLARLQAQGTFTTGLLLERSETPTRRQYLADQVDATRTTSTTGATRR